MRVKWFGSPWPSRETRAPICDSDEDEIEVPVGKTCIECGAVITERDRGTVTKCSTSFWEHWLLEIDGVEHPVCAYHLHCFLKNTMGKEMGQVILDRMRKTPLMDELPPLHVTPLPTDVKPGRGWRKAEPVVGDDDESAR